MHHTLSNATWKLYRRHPVFGCPFTGVIASGMVANIQDWRHDARPHN
jgi:hypothetical protein